MDSEKIANISIIEPARIPLKPAKPNVPLNLALGFLLGAVGGVGLAFFREYLDDTLQRPEQIEKTLRVPVLASVPEFVRQATKN
jgi:capsular polysaccharide biosynthesis protein